MWTAKGEGVLHCYSIKWCTVAWIWCFHFNSYIMNFCCKYVTTYDIKFHRNLLKNGIFFGTDMNWPPISKIQTILHPARLLQDCFRIVPRFYNNLAFYKVSKVGGGPLTKHLLDCCRIVEWFLVLSQIQYIVCNIYVYFHMYYAWVSRMLQDCFKIIAGLLQDCRHSFKIDTIHTLSKIILLRGISKVIQWLIW